MWRLASARSSGDSGSIGRSLGVVRAPRRASRLRSLLLGLAGLAMVTAPARAAGEAERCAALIEAFDELVVTDFDRRLLAVEDFELAEARGLRRQAEADCAAGRSRFRLDAIEEAFWRIGIPPPNEEGRPSP
jgi:hypothetical protein